MYMEVRFLAIARTCLFGITKECQICTYEEILLGQHDVRPTPLNKWSAPPPLPTNSLNTLPPRCEFHEGYSQRYLHLHQARQIHNNAHAVFITVALGGIGLATARSFTKAGASQIALSSVKPLPPGTHESLQAAARAPNRKPPQLLTLHLNPLDSFSISKAVGTITSSIGNPDILIKNAGSLATFPYLFLGW